MGKMKNFKDFLKETKQYHIYCDLDGTLCDFISAAEKVFGTKDFHKNIPEDQFWDRLSPKHIENFFGNLKWLQGAKQLWALIQPYNPTILTATSNPWAIPQKRQWVQLHLGKNVPIIFTRSQLKHIHADHNSILIDDRSDIIHNWKSKGGIGIHATNPKVAIQQLKPYLT